MHIAIWFMCTDLLLFHSSKIWQIPSHSAWYSKFPFLTGFCDSESFNSVNKELEFKMILTLHRIKWGWNYEEWVFTYKAYNRNQSQQGTFLCFVKYENLPCLMRSIHSATHTCSAQQYKSTQLIKINLNNCSSLILYIWIITLFCLSEKKKKVKISHHYGES